MTTPDEPTPDEAPRPPAEPTAPAEPPRAAPAATPTAAELERIAEPVHVRRAPKFGAFITAGVLVGVVLAVVLVGAVDTAGVEVAPGSGFLPFLEGPSGVVTVLAVLLGGLGALVGGWCRGARGPAQRARRRRSDAAGDRRRG